MKHFRGVLQKALIKLPSPPSRSESTGAQRSRQQQRLAQHYPEKGRMSNFQHSPIIFAQESILVRTVHASIRGKEVPMEATPSLGASAGMTRLKNKINPNS